MKITLAVVFPHHYYASDKLFLMKNRSIWTRAHLAFDSLLAKNTTQS